MYVRGVRIHAHRYFFLLVRPFPPLFLSFQSRCASSTHTGPLSASFPFAMTFSIFLLMPIILVPQPTSLPYMCIVFFPLSLPCASARLRASRPLDFFSTAVPVRVLFVRCASYVPSYRVYVFCYATLIVYSDFLVVLSYTTYLIFSCLDTRILVFIFCASVSS